MTKSEIKNLQSAIKSHIMRSLIAFLFLMFVTTVYSQTIVDTNKVWSTLISYYDPFVDRTEVIKFEGDTTIELKNYKSVFCSMDSLQTNWVSYGYVREDLTKKVFYRISETDTEKLMYDFNLNVNDSVYAYDLYDFTNLLYRSSEYHVSSIDSVLIGNTLRKRIHLDIISSGDTLSDIQQWVETVGSMNGIFRGNHGAVGCDNFSFLCFIENDTLKYQNTNYSSCYYSNESHINETPYKGFTISQNPVVDRSLIQLNDESIEEQFSIEIYNDKGIILRNETFFNEYEVNSSDFRSGLYFIRILKENRVVWTGKVLIINSR